MSKTSNGQGQENEYGQPTARDPLFLVTGDPNLKVDIGWGQADSSSKKNSVENMSKGPRALQTAEKCSVGPKRKESLLVRGN